MPRVHATRVRARDPLGHLRSDRRGSVAILVALLGTVLAGLAALALDVSRWEMNANAMQGAADQAALAASFALANGTAAAQKEALGIAAAYGFVNGKGGVQVTVAIPPASGAYAGTANAIQVTVAQPQTRSLSGMITGSAPTISASAVATPSQAGTCIMALSTNGNAISGSDVGTITAQNCNVYVNSPTDCAVSLSSSTLTGYDVYLGETYDCHGDVAATDKLVHGAPAAADPYASRTMPTPSSPCVQPDLSQPHVTLNPGTYCSTTITGPKTITLNNGVYIFTGSLVTSGNVTLTGSNVTLVFTNNGGLSAGGGSSLNLTLTPMTTGPTAGIAIWVSSGQSSTLDLRDSINFLSITGAVYAPSEQVEWASNANSSCTQLIANTILFHGSSSDPPVFQHNCSGLGVSDVAGSSSSNYTLTE